MRLYEVQEMLNESTSELNAAFPSPIATDKTHSL